MTTGIEGSLYASLVGVFGGNLILMSLFFISVFVVFMLFLGLPKIIFIPMGIFLVTVFSVGTYAPLPQLNIIIGLIAGVLVAYLIMKVWG